MKYQIKKQIEAGYANLSRSEKQAADYILEHMEETGRLSLDKLAKNAKVSQPTVLRMLKSIGFDGYKSFRYRLVSELAREGGGEKEETVPVYGYTLEQKSVLEDLPVSMTVTTQRMLDETMKNLPVRTYRKAVEALTKARMIDIYGIENSAAPALDLLTKLMYLGLPCRYFSDPYLQQIAAGNLTSEDVAVGISYSGESRDTADTMRAAAKAGARTIVITNSADSRLCRNAEIVISTEQQQPLYGEDIFSRSTQFFIVDLLYMGVIASDREYFTERLRKCGKAVKKKAYPHKQK